MSPGDAFETNPSAVLKSSDGQFLFEVTSTGYEFPAIAEGHDADWQRNTFRIKSGVFSAQFSGACLEGRLLQHLIPQFEAFSELKRESLEFEPTEPYFRFEYSFDTRKNILVRALIQFPVGTGPELHSEFETDLSHFDIFLKGLKEILARYPVRF